MSRENLQRSQEEKDDEPVTMLDFLEQQQELEEEYVAVLGGSDEKCCTYSEGYIKRQALYMCLTCCPEVVSDLSKASGICLACSYQCHENHELIELYTKRNFRCDCPTEKIPGKKCNFHTLNDETTKMPINLENKYNQNFSGAYCTCKRPYPDPEDPISDDMIQCCFCEDWYHSRHLNTLVPKPVSYSEMVCEECMEQYNFLKDYTGLAVKVVENAGESTISATEDDKLKSDLDKSISDIMNISQSSIPEETLPSSEEYEPSTKKVKHSDSVTCIRPSLKGDYTKGAVFWPNQWRKNLCLCSTCKELYLSHHVDFLLDATDTSQYYEETGLKKNTESVYDRGIRALSKMDRVQQLDAIHEYNIMKDKLKEFLQSFVVSKKIVTESDINSFFQNMKNEKNANIGLPHFCR